MRGAIGGAALGAMVMSGCLGAPNERTCADYPRDTPECADYWRGDGSIEPDAGGETTLDATSDATGTPDAMGDGMLDGMSDDMGDGMADVTVDLGPDAGCMPGETRPCGSEEGACEPGEQRCVDGAFGACEGAVGPTEEVCNGVDDDCNGAVDDVAEAGGACSDERVIACAAEGVVACVAGGPPGLVCELLDGDRRADARCDGVDDDCDGFIDEGFGELQTLRMPSSGPDAAPAIAAWGGSFGAAWIGVDNDIRFARFLGDVFTVDPFVLFGGGERRTEGVALGAGSRGFVLGLSYCDDLGCGASLSVLDDRGAFVQTVYVGPFSARQMSVAAHDRGAGFAAASDGGIGFAHVADFAVANAEPHRISGLEVRYDQPSLAWSAERYGLVYVAGEPGGADPRGTVEFRAVEVDGTAQPRVALSGPGASAPTLVGLRGHGGYMASWIEPVDGLSTARAVVLDGDGEVVAGPFELGPGAASPALMPYDDPTGARVGRVGVAWLAQEAGRQRVTMRWLELSAGAWVMRPAVRVGEARDAAALVGAHSLGEGLALLMRDVEGRTAAPVALTGEPQCEVEACDVECGADQTCVGGACVFVGSCAAPRPLDGRAEGTTVGAPAVSIEASCTAGGAQTAFGPEVVFVYRPDVAGEVCLSTVQSSYDTLLYVRTTCDDAMSEVACSEDAGFMPRPTAGAVTLEAVAGVDYYVFVDGYTAATQGEFVLDATPGRCVP